MFTYFREQSTYWRICSNLAACISASPKVPADRADTAMFRTARLTKFSLGRSLWASGFLHIVAIACLVNLPSFPNPLAEHPQRLVLSDHKIVWYNKTSLLPAISPPEGSAPKGPKKISRPAS